MEAWLNITKRNAKGHNEVDQIKDERLDNIKEVGERIKLRATKLEEKLENSMRHP